MSGQWVFIEPNDVWMFRDNKPFQAQQNFVARGQFPPTPMTMQGVIRSYYLENALEQTGASWDNYREGNVNQAIIDAVGLPAVPDRPASFGKLNLQGPFVAQKTDSQATEILIQSPLDLRVHKDTNETALLHPERLPETTLSDMPFDGWQPLVGGGEGFKETSSWLTEKQFLAYLNGDVDAIGGMKKTEDVYQIEERVGVGLDYNRRAYVESMFYHAEFVRPCPGVGLVVHVNMDIFETENGVINIGGESRSGRYRVFDNVTTFPQKGQGNVRIVLLTPAWFSGGWHPENMDWSPWVGSGRLVSAAIGKPVPIGGYDIANRMPKPIYHYVPAGSVFFFENADVTRITFTEYPHGALDYGALGFGAFAVGVW